MPLLKPRDRWHRFVSITFGLVALVTAIQATGSVIHPAVARSPMTTLGCLAAAAVVVCWAPFAGLRRVVRAAVFESRPALFSSAVGFLGTATFSWISIRVFDGVPHLDDSVAALFSAEALLSGRLTLPLPAYPEFFKVFGVLSASDGVPHLAGMYPPGWSLLLMPGVALGAPWLINPLLGGALAVVVTALGSELYDRAVGRVAGILVVSSPLVGVVSATHLSHTSTALLLCLCWWATLRSSRTGLLRYGAMAGAGLGLAVLTRPVTAVILGLIIVLLPLSRPRQLLVQWRSNLVAVSAVAIGVALLLGYQQVTTGDALTPGHRLQLGEHGGMGWVAFSEYIEHTPAKAVEMTIERIRVVDANLLGWPLLASVVVLAPFLLGAAGWREIWLLAPGLALSAFYAGFWYFPGYFPGRYLFAALAPLLILSAVGWKRSSEALQGKAGWRALPAVVLVFGLLFSVVCGRPDYLSRFGRHHGDVETVLPAMVNLYGITDALVFVAATGRWDREWDLENDYYASGFRLNDLDLAGDVVYARSLGEKNALLMAAYPGRSHYLYVFHRDTRRGRLYRIGRDGQGELTYKQVRQRRRSRPAGRDNG